jgi:GDP-mannose 6-dehydrogenase
VNVSIFGLGYVGTVTAACLAHRGHHVIGVDTNRFKVDSINSGRCPIVEPGLDELLRTVLDRGQLEATDDVNSAVLKSDISLICVGTPSNPNGSLDLEQVLRVAEQIGEVLKSKPGYHGIALRSTVLPGTVDNIVQTIESVSGKRAEQDFGVASNPEFLREGTSIADFENPPFTVVGVNDDKLAHLLTELYQDLGAPLHFVKVKEAELLKYACNAFHAVKVTFANEIGAISKQLGIDSHTVMGIFAADVKLNISPLYLKPGFAFGGSCLPKDIRAITHESRTLDISTPLLNSLVVSNQVQIDRVVDWVIEKKRKRVGILGLSFKSGTDDLRESPVVRVVETLLGKGFSLSIYDPNVNISKLLGANRSYIEQEIPHVSSLMKDSAAEVLDQSDVVLIANRGSGFEEVPRMLRPGQTVLDLIRVSDDITTTVAGTYEGISW